MTQRQLVIFMIVVFVSLYVWIWYVTERWQGGLPVGDGCGQNSR
jgi:hypothetical protein